MSGDWLADCEDGEITLLVRMAVSGEVVARVRLWPTATLQKLRWAIARAIKDCPPFKMFRGQALLKSADQSILDAGIVEGDAIGIVFLATATVSSADAGRGS